MGSIDIPSSVSTMSLLSKISSTIFIISSGASMLRATNISTVVISWLIMVLITLYNTLIDTSSNMGPIARLISLPPISIMTVVKLPAKSNPPS